MIRHCETCGKPIRVIPSRLKEGKGRFCSKECQYNKTAEQRFWEHVNKLGPLCERLGSHCWEWTGSTAGAGLPYGRFWDGKQIVMAHRFSWSIANGPIPDGLDMLHHCDNPKCVRPDHLHLGTHAENIQEMWDRGRNDYTGVRNPAAKLDPGQADEIRRLYGHRGKDGLTLQALADRYEVGTSTIHRIITGKAWREEVPYE